MVTSGSGVQRVGSAAPAARADMDAVLHRLLQVTAHSWWEGGAPAVRGRKRQISSLHRHWSTLAQRVHQSIGDRMRHAVGPATGYAGN